LQKPPDIHVTNINAYDRLIGKHTTAGDKEQMVPLAEVQAQTDQT